MKTIFTILAFCALTCFSSFGFYNPSTGRWLSRDPIEEAAGPNLFVIVGNSPGGSVDAWGKEDSLSPDNPTQAPRPPNASASIQLEQFRQSLQANKQVFTTALRTLCPVCPVSFQTVKGRTETCEYFNCVAQAQLVVLDWASKYEVVFTKEYQKFGDILTGLDGNERADKAPHRGVAAIDYDKGFGLKCVGWMELSEDIFEAALGRFYQDGRLCFRGAVIGKPKDRSSWFNHSWIAIYGPERGTLSRTRFTRADYDYPVDPWPSAGSVISPLVTPFEAERFDAPLLW
jgi:hypothetical protein